MSEKFNKIANLTRRLSACYNIQNTFLGDLLSKSGSYGLSIHK